MITSRLVIQRTANDRDKPDSRDSSQDHHYRDAFAIHDGWYRVETRRASFARTISTWCWSISR